MSPPIRTHLNGRYAILTEIGHGAQGHTYQALDTSTGELVAVKRLSLKTATQWKAVDLFEREVATLRRLNHPGIPRFIDAFAVGESEFYLVQSFLQGRNLDQMLRESVLFTPAQIEQIARQLLKILTYLHGQDPAVLHRDIKPANVIVGSKGQLSLVDFGAVQSQDSRGTTVVGTSGYMPPEQLTGRAVPASDLYAVGATLVHLATRVHPSDLPLERLKLDWRRYANVDDRLATWLDRLIAPEHEDRPRSAEEALRWLDTSYETPGVPAPMSSTAMRPRSSKSPSGTIEANITADGLEMTFRPATFIGFASVTPSVWLTSGYVIFLVAFSITHVSALVLGIFSVSMVVRDYRLQSSTRVLTITPQRAELRINGLIEKSAPTAHIKGAERDQNRNFGVLLDAGGEHWHLRRTISNKEIEWVSHEIRKYLATIR